jgi:rod shape-determining protein MreD
MKNLFLFLLCVIVVFLQFSALGVFFSGRRIPDLALALVITLVLALGFKESLKWILLIGILIDAGSPSIFGTVTLAYFLIGWMTAGLGNVSDIRSRKTFFLAVFAAAVLVFEVAKDMLILASLSINNNFSREPSGAWLNIFGFDYFLKILYTVIAAYVIYYIFRWVIRSFFWEPIRLTKRDY